MRDTNEPIVKHEEIERRAYEFTCNVGAETDGTWTIGLPRNKN